MPCCACFRLQLTFVVSQMVDYVLQSGPFARAKEFLKSVAISHAGERLFRVVCVQQILVGNALKVEPQYRFMANSAFLKHLPGIEARDVTVALHIARQLGETIDG